MTVDQGVAREQWDATNYAAKDNLLRVVREEAEAFFALAEVPRTGSLPRPRGTGRFVTSSGI